MIKQTSEGFTLIEMMVVVVIIGILTAIILASLSRSRLNAKATKIASELSSARALAEQYYVTTGGETYGPLTLRSGCKTSAGNIFGSSPNSLKSILDDILTIVTSPDTYCSVGATGEVNGSSWAMSVKDPSNTAYYFCIDATGILKRTAPGIINNTITPQANGAYCT